MSKEIILDEFKKLKEDTKSLIKKRAGNGNLSGLESFLSKNMDLENEIIDLCDYSTIRDVIKIIKGSDVGDFDPRIATEEKVEYIKKQIEELL